MGRALRMMEGKTFGPTTLKVVGQAFDEAWAKMGSSFNART
jgi:hypothetical protein